MSAPKNIRIDVARGASKQLNFVLEDKIDLSAAVIKFTVKRMATDPDTEIVITKNIDTGLSDSLPNGQFVIVLDPADTANLSPRTYVYDLNIQIGNKIYTPLVGDFSVYATVRRQF